MSYLLSFPSPPTHLLLNSFQTGFCSQRVTDSACQVLPGHPSAKPYGCSSVLTSLSSTNIWCSQAPLPSQDPLFQSFRTLSSPASLSQCPCPPIFCLSSKWGVLQGLPSGSPLCLRVSCAHLSLKAVSITALLSVSVRYISRVVIARGKGGGSTGSWAKEGMNRDRKRPCFGWWVHDAVCK